MKNTSTIVYLAFITLIGFSVWVTSSATPLWAILLIDFVPKWIRSQAEDDSKNNKNNEEVV